MARHGGRRRTRKWPAPNARNVRSSTMAVALHLGVGLLGMVAFVVAVLLLT